MRPGLGLGGVTEQVHDDGTLLDSLVNLEKVDAGLPAILDGLLPALAVFSDTNDDVEAVVAEVEALAVTLGAVADEGEGVVLEVLLEDGQSRAFSEPLMDWYTYKELLTGPVGALCHVPSAIGSSHRAIDSPCIP